MAKLIRDTVALDILKQNPERVAMFVRYEDRKKALTNKIIEETLELSAELEAKDVDKDSVAEEAADIIEVIYAICDFHGIDVEEVYEMMIAKRRIKGKFLSFCCLLPK